MPSKLNAFLRDTAIALAEFFPGSHDLSIVGKNFEGKPLSLPIPSGQFVPYAAPPAPEVATPAKPEPQCDEDQEIIDVLTNAGHSLTADELAAEIGCENSPRFRLRLSGLVKAKKIENLRPGYQILGAVNSS